MPLIFTVMFLRSAVAKFFYPAQNALVQGVLPKDGQVSAAGLNQTAVSIMILFGNTIGAACYWSFGVEGAMIVDASLGLLPRMGQIVDPKMMGRVNGFRIPLMTIAQGVSLLAIAATFPKYMSVTAAFLIMGGLLVVTAVYKWMSLPALVRKLEEETADVPLAQAQAGRPL